jgi:hypothetical protein
MAVQVIDAFEVVEVQQEHRVRPVGARRRGNRGLQLLIELAAIWQPRQSVLMGKLARPVFRFDPVCHFASQRQKKTPGYHEKADAKYGGQGNGFVEFDYLRLRCHAQRIF